MRLSDFISTMPTAIHFWIFCETVKMIGLNKKHELNYLTSQQCIIHNHVLKSMLDTIANETASCVSYSRGMKLFLFCYKVVDIISAS